MGLAFFATRRSIQNGPADDRQAVDRRGRVIVRREACRPVCRPLLSQLRLSIRPSPPQPLPGPTGVLAVGMNGATGWIGLLSPNMYLIGYGGLPTSLPF
jgi:hypothetical protein